ncbi:diadenylate cyclase, partial [bacterium]|nr:diadenylate cyclase [bacterium]
MLQTLFNSWATFWTSVWAALTWVDLFDVSIITVFFYAALTWLQRRTSRSVAVALAPVVGLFLLAYILEMPLTSLLLQTGITAIAVGFVVLYQEDFRRWFETLSVWTLWPWQPQKSSRQRLNQILYECFSSFSTSKTGALVIMRGNQELNPHIRGGVPVNGFVSAPLLYSIFDHHSPGHDGAVTLVGDRIEKLGVHLPLSRNLDQVGRLGTRHAAALGLAERCDSLVLVASEETGHISVAWNGRIRALHSADELPAVLHEFGASLNRVEAAPPNWRSWRHNWGRPSLAVSLAFLTWFLHTRPSDFVQQSAEATVVFRNVPSDWEAKPPYPSTVRVTMAGPRGALDTLARTEFTAGVDMGHIREGVQSVGIDSNSIKVPARTRIVRIDPREVSVQAYPAQVVTLPVRPSLETA